MVGGMRVTLKTVNEKLADLGTKAEVLRGAGYFLFRGGEAEEWIDRTVRVPTISSLTLAQWVNEYKRLKTLNDDMMKAAEQASPRPAKAHKQRDVASAQAAPTQAARTRDSAHKEVCSVKAKLLAELDQAHKGLLDTQEQEVRAAREDRVSDLVNLSVATSRARGKFDRALLAIRDHTLVRTQRLERVDAGSPPGRQVSSKQRDGHNHKTDRGQGERIVGGRSVEEGCKQAG